MSTSILDAHDAAGPRTDGAVHALPTPEPVADLDRLGDEIAELSAHLEAATARLLDLIREFDARGGWNNGFRSCADWLSWRVGLDLGAAREQVRVARALGTLPLLAQALARGELSYAKVRALTRVATPETEERLLAVGRAGTAEHVERIVRGWRRVDRKAEAREASSTAHEPGAARVSGRGRHGRGPRAAGAGGRARCSCRRWPRRARRCISSAAPETSRGRRGDVRADGRADDGPAAGRRAGPARRDGAPPRARSRRARASATRSSSTSTPRCWPTPMQPGQSVLEDGARVSAETSQRLACDASRVVMRHDADGPRAWRSAPGPGRFRRRYGGRSTIATAAAASRAAACGSARAITSATGRRAARPRSRISRCSVAGTTARCTRRATRSSDSPTARCSSGDPDGRLLPDVPPPPAVPADPVAGPPRAATPRRACSSTRARRCPGWLGERLDVGYAIDVLHPLAIRPRESSPATDPA